MSVVELEHVTVQRAGVTPLDDIGLEVADGELVGVVGPSGAGKTTLLRVIAGLDQPSSGSIRIDGVDVGAAAPSERGVSMVFQTAVLLPHLDVHHNIAFPLEVRHQRTDEIAARVAAETRALHIEALLTRSPRDLSAGEAQLVQVARALVKLPALLLLDEPLAHLDAVLTHRMRLELRSLQQGYGVTTVLATNDPVEAMALADRLVVLDAGRVVQIGPPVEIYEHPASLVAAGCTGHMSTFTVEIEADADGFWLVHPSFRHRAWRPSLAGYVGAYVVVGLRPAWASVDTAGQVAATVVEASPVTSTITVAIAGGHADQLEIVAPAAVHHRRGDEVAVRFDELALFDPLTGDHLP
jgi:ABC-type sugar transport system ATPase subunit